LKKRSKKLFCSASRGAEKSRHAGAGRHPRLILNTRQNMRSEAQKIIRRFRRFAQIFSLLICVNLRNLRINLVHD